MTDNPNSLELRLYRRMLLIRRAEEMLMAEYHPANEMRCPMHFCVGQEAMPAVLSEAIRHDDILMSHYRSHGYYLAKGAPLNAMIAEFYGKQTGANGGVAGSMELASHSHNYFSGAIVGGTTVIPLGSAFAQKYRSSSDISVSVFGDGALDEGVTYETFNLAALHHLPLLFVCENNKYAAHTSIGRRMAATSLSDRARVFGLPVTKLTDSDPLALRDRLLPIVTGIRSGIGPHFIELETYRHSAHVGPGNDDAMGYRTAEEMEEWKARDPLERLRKIVLESLGQPTLDAALNDTDATVSDAIKFAKSSKFPDYAKTIATNWSGEYSSVVKRFVTNPARAFDSAQAESRPGPF